MIDFENRYKNKIFVKRLSEKSALTINNLYELADDENLIEQ